MIIPKGAIIASFVYEKSSNLKRLHRHFVWYGQKWLHQEQNYFFNGGSNLS